MVCHLQLPVFAFDFAHPAMLGWLAAAAAPILIHLWSRRRYRDATWAAMEYLAAALRQSRRRLLLEHWLLLVVRTLVIVLVVAAVAEPMIQRSGLAVARGQRKHRVLVLDGSFSMAYKPSDKSRFDRAKQLAAQIVEESDQGDGFSLVLMSDPPRVVVGKPALEPRDFLKEIGLLELPHTTADLARTLELVEQVLLAARREEPRLTRQEVYFLTDLGRVGWGPDRLGPAALADVQQRAARLAESASLAVIDLGQPDAANVAVTALQARDPVATLARELEVQAQLKGFGLQGRSRVPVEWLVDGRRVGRQEVDLAPGAQAEARFAYRFDAPGDHVMEVRTEGDLLEIDNHRWLAVPVKESIPVLCVDGRPSGTMLGGATRYLAVALSPEAAGEGRGLVRADVVSENRLAEMDLGRYECVFLANVPQFTAGEARLLERYVRGGGGLVFFLGDRVLADRYEEELGAGRAGRPALLPARLGPVVEKPSNRLDPLDYRHPIVEAFRGRERAGLLTAPVGRHFRLSLAPESKARVALALAAGDPLVVEAPMGRGRVVLVGTSPDTSWTALPVWPSFVPLVHEILHFAMGRQADRRNVVVGEPLEGTVPAAAADAPLMVRGPQGRSEPIAARLDEELSVWSYAGTWTSGSYWAQWGPPLARADAYAVNVDPAESDLAPITAEELRDEVWPGVPLSCETTWQDKEETGLGRPGRSSGLAQGLLYGVFVLLLVETFLARRFGHHE